MERRKIINENFMSENRRQLFFKVMDGNPDLIGTMHVLSHYKFCDNFLKYMVDNKIVGNDLAGLLNDKFFGDPHKFVKEFLVPRVNLTVERINNPILLKM